MVEGPLLVTLSHELSVNILGFSVPQQDFSLTFPKSVEFEACDFANTKLIMGRPGWA